MEQPVWYCTSSRSHTTVAKYAEYQAETIKEHYEKSVSFAFETIFLFTYLPRPIFFVLNFPLARETDKKKPSNFEKIQFFNDKIVPINPKLKTVI